MVKIEDQVLVNTLYREKSAGKDIVVREVEHRGKVISVKVGNSSKEASRNHLVKASIALMKEIKDKKDLRTFDERIEWLEYLKSHIVHEVPKNKRSTKLKLSQFFGRLFYNREKKLDEAIQWLKDESTAQELRVSRIVEKTVEKYIKKYIKDYKNIKSAEVPEKSVPELKRIVGRVINPLLLSEKQLLNAIDGGILKAANILENLTNDSRQNLVKTFRPKSKQNQNPDVEPEKNPRVSLKIKKLALNETALDDQEQVKFKTLWQSVARKEDLPETEGAFERAYLKVAKKSLKYPDNKKVSDLLSLLEKIHGKTKAEKLMDEAKLIFQMRKRK